MKNAWHVVLIAALAGCAIQPGPGNVGNGRYMQILVGTEVVYEMDVVAAGHQNCPNQVGNILRQNPNLSARCAHEPTTQPMPFSFKALNQSNVQDEIKPSSPYLVRLSTSSRCKAVMTATRGEPKSVILEDHCGTPQNDTVPVSPKATTATAAPIKAIAPTSALQANPLPVTNTSRDEATSLQKLKELRDKGLISEDEFNKKRKEILDRL